MSYAEDNFHDLDPELLNLFGSDFDVDTDRIKLAWQCKDGTVINIEDMTTNHIKNCIAMIKKSVNNDQPWRLEYLQPLLDELEDREFFEAMRNMSDKEFNQLIHRGKK